MDQALTRPFVDEDACREWAVEMFKRHARKARPDTDYDEDIEYLEHAVLAFAREWAAQSPVTHDPSGLPCGCHHAPWCGSARDLPDRQPSGLTASTREAQFYRKPGRAGRYHVNLGDSEYPSAACSDQLPLSAEDLEPVEKVPDYMRCQRPGCRVRWPK